MKKGFTLIELMAVILILSIIAAITIPVTINVIDEIRIHSQEESVFGISKAIELYLTDNNVSSDIFDKIDYKGKKPDYNELSVSQDEEEIALKIVYGDNCYIKINDVISYYDNIEDCSLPVYTTNLTNILDNIEATLLNVSYSESDTQYYKDAKIVEIDDKYVYQGKDPSNYLVFGNACFRIVNYSEDEIKIIYDGNKDATVANPCMHQYNGSAGLVSNWGSIGETSFGTNNDWLDNSNNIRSMFESLLNDETIDTNDNIVIGNTNYGTINIDNYEKLVLKKGNFSISDLSEADVGTTSTIENIEDKEKLVRYDSNISIYNGYIGLLSISEYLRGSSNLECTTYVSGSNQCDQNNYLYNSYGSWTMNRVINNNVNNNGTHYYPFSSYFYSATSTFNIKPVLYLKSDVTFYGTGTFFDPFRLTKEIQ